jgi:hypothetical protein
VCGSTVRLDHKARHIKSKKHKEFKTLVLDKYKNIEAKKNADIIKLIEENINQLREILCDTSDKETAHKIMPVLAKMRAACLSSK